MADRIDVDVTGKSKYQVADEMARHILYTVERKAGITRNDYLKAVEQCLYVLNGGPAPG